jgi:hypothetical protein
VAAGAARRTRPLSTPPPPAVLAAFGVDDATLLTGGQGTTYRAGDIVVKPVLDVVEAEWVAALVDGLPHPDDLRIIRPVRASDGSWVVDGWAAWRWLEGEHRLLPTVALLALADRLHRLLRDVPWSPVLETDSPWARGHAWAHGEIELEVPPSFAAVVAELRAIAGTPSPDERRQLIHGDIAGNVLIADGLAPAIIDLSLDWAATDYAKAIVVVDAVGWLGAPAEDLALVPPHLAARAALFRLGSAAVLCADDEPRLRRELSVYGPFAERLRSPAP